MKNDEAEKVTEGILFEETLLAFAKTVGFNPLYEIKLENASYDCDQPYEFCSGTNENISVNRVSVHFFPLEQDDAVALAKCYADKYSVYGENVAMSSELPAHECDGESNAKDIPNAKNLNRYKEHSFAGRE